MVKFHLNFKNELRKFVKNPKIIFRKLFLVCENCFIFFIPKTYFRFAFSFSRREVKSHFYTGV